LEALPDLATLTDAELRDLIRRLLKEEQEISYRRRLLHGRIDILRAELVARLHRQVGAGETPLHEVDLGKLSEILAVKAAPAISDEELGESDGEQG
jgi:anti-sigma-K factor RsiG